MASVREREVDAINAVARETKKDLVARCQQLGLSIGGNKSDLQRRLQNHAHPELADSSAGGGSSSAAQVPSRKSRGKVVSKKRAVVESDSESESSDLADSSESEADAGGGSSSTAVAKPASGDSLKRRRTTPARNPQCDDDDSEGDDSDLPAAGSADLASSDSDSADSDSPSDSDIHTVERIISRKFDTKVTRLCRIRTHDSELVFVIVGPPCQ